jgi:hypothetical protein
MIKELCEKCKHEIIKSMCWEADCLCKCVDTVEERVIEVCKKCDHILDHGICEMPACPCVCEKR